MGRQLDFNSLVVSIDELNKALTIHASKAINISLTLRNWLIGCYIAEYQLNGEDRAKHGDKLLQILSNTLTELNLSNCKRRQLYDYLNFYRIYPDILKALPGQFKTLLPSKLTAISKVPTVSAQLGVPTQQLTSKLSYSHFKLLISIDDPTKRVFYECECVKGNWSVRELQKQIGSLYFERSGLSHDKSTLSELASQGAQENSLALSIKDPYLFDFIGLKSQEVMGESHLEDQLINKIQDFLLELGHGFCFEVRQKRILIGDEHYFVDLVFYHRIIKCHVLVELKIESFNHENIGQLNTYVNWYKKNVQMYKWTMIIRQLVSYFVRTKTTLWQSTL